ncbi:MAG: hypothetical protein R3F54_29125 [Alphaproteobacteria bacterium]
MTRHDAAHQVMTTDDETAFDGDLLRQLGADLSDRLLAAGIDPGIASDGNSSSAFAVDGYIDLFDSLPSPIAYDHFPSAARERCDAIVSQGGEPALDAYLRLVLVRLIGGFDERAAARGLPSWLEGRTRAFLRDLLAELQKPPRRFLQPDQDTFMKDFAVCRLKLWPCGAELVDVASGLPRRVLLQGGARQFARVLLQVGAALGGFKPFFETHFDSRRAGAFSVEGYRDLYLTIARILQDRPDVKGMYSCSWWHDPVAIAISPNLAFLNDLPLGGGARLFRMSASEQTVRVATRLSRERTARFRQGSYHPTRYVVVWGRRDLLAWAEAQSPAGIHSS